MYDSDIIGNTGSTFWAGWNMFEEARRCIFGGKRDGADGRQKASWAELTGKVFWRVVAAAAVVAAASGGLRQQQLEDTQVDRRRSLARGNTAAETGNTTAVPGNTTGQYSRTTPSHSDGHPIWWPACGDSFLDLQNPLSIPLLIKDKIWVCQPFSNCQFNFDKAHLVFAPSINCLIRDWNLCSFILMAVHSICSNIVQSTSSSFSTNECTAECRISYENCECFWQKKSIWHVLSSYRMLSKFLVRFSKWLQGFKKGVINLFLCIAMAYNVFPCIEIIKNTQTEKIADFTM